MLSYRITESTWLCYTLKLKVIHTSQIPTKKLCADLVSFSPSNLLRIWCWRIYITCCGLFWHWWHEFSSYPSWIRFLNPNSFFFLSSFLWQIKRNFLDDDTWELRDSKFELDQVQISSGLTYTHFPNSHSNNFKSSTRTSSRNSIMSKKCLN